MTGAPHPATPAAALKRPHVLYITRTGMLEPLGQSQVLAYLRRLSRSYRITLVSYEKPEDRADTAAMARVRADCATHGIRWLPQPFHSRPKLLAAAWSMIVFCWICLRLARRDGVALIHARSYLPAAVALLVKRITGTPFLFDMRALWPEELVASGRVRRGSLFHRALLRAERACLHRAAAVVSLTQAAVDHLRRIYPAELADQRIQVIPTCADLARFVPAEVPPPGRIYGCVGTVVSGWFRLDWLAAFYQAVAKADPNALFEIVTRDDADTVRGRMGGDAAFQSRLKIYAMPPHLVHQAMQRHSVSVMFYADNLSRLGCSPTRMGEALGCGIPVVTNPGVGDTTSIVRDRRVGVLARGPDAVDMAAAIEDLEGLRTDASLAARCRATAKNIFSLEAGTAAYAALYAAITAAAPVPDKLEELCA